MKLLYVNVVFQCCFGGLFYTPTCNDWTHLISDTDTTVDIVVYLRGCSVVLADAPSGECTVLDKQMIDEMKKGMLGLGDYYSNLAGEFCNCEGNNCNSMKAPEIGT